MTARKRRSERSEVLELVETEGLKAAVGALIAVCNDKSAPAPARATSATTLARIGALGGFGRNYSPDAAEKESWELSAEELAERIAEGEARMRRRAEQRAAGYPADDDGSEADEDDETETDDEREDDGSPFD